MIDLHRIYFSSPDNKITLALCLALSYNIPMDISKIAKELGRRGGLKRASRLSPEERKDIATQGGAARAESYALARRIDVNFRYVEALHELSPPVRVKSLKSCRYKLPDIHG